MWLKGIKLAAKPRWKSWDQASKNLDELIAKVERQAKREATRKAATPMLKAARAKAPVATELGGDLKKALKVKVTTYKANKVIVATIGPDRKATGRGKNIRGEEVETKPVKYAHLVEFGSVHNPTAKPFMRPAFDETKDECTRIYAAEIGPAIQRVAKRVNKKYPIT